MRDYKVLNLLRYKCIILVFTLSVGISFAESNRWVPIKNPKNIKLFYDYKTIKKSGSDSFNFWLKFPAGELTEVSLDCKERTIDGTSIPPESLSEAIYDQLCDEPIELKPPAINPERNAQVDLGPWVAELQRRIRRNWMPSSEVRNKRVVALIQVQRDGRVKNIEITEYSNSLNAYNAALSAIRASAPFREFPQSFNGEDIQIRFVFGNEIYGYGNAQIETSE